SPLYLLSGDQPLLEAVLADTVDDHPRLEFLAPLDPMLWDRKLIEAIWDFQYSWEIYTPQEKRKYGYYVLPMLWGDRFIGRIEAAADRKMHALIVKNVWYESGVRQTKGLARALDRAIIRLAKLNGMDQARFSRP
ncbi:MAG: winged helix-turn-helix domain-containing protein, partial [Clostridiales bacterium]|nr:winged helix-turn-helix domain-containing protein [Clostridiales bacterium]